MAQVDEDWEKRAFSPGVSAHREFMVADVIGPLQAAYAQGIPAEGQMCDWDASLIANAPQVTQVGAGNVYMVSVDYAPLDPLTPGEASTQVGGMPNLTYQWMQGETTEPRSYDANLVAITNSALDPFDPPPQVEVPTLFLTIQRIEPAYDVVKAMRFQRTINSDQLIVYGCGAVNPGLMLCHSIQPTAAHKPSDTKIQVEYRFELRADGFAHKLLDQGYRGWRQTNGVWELATFVDRDNNTLAQPVRLNGSGKPIDQKTKLKGGIDAQTFKQLAGVGIESNRDIGCFLIYQKYKSMPFRDLGLFA